MKRIDFRTGAIIERKDVASTATKTKAKTPKAEAGDDDSEIEPSGESVRTLVRAKATRFMHNGLNKDKTAQIEQTIIGRLLGVKRVAKMDINGKPILSKTTGKAIVTAIYNVVSVEDEQFTLFSAWGFYESNKMPNRSLIQCTVQHVEEGDVFGEGTDASIAESNFLSLRDIQLTEVSLYYRAKGKYLFATLTDPSERAFELEMLKEERLAETALLAKADNTIAEAIPVATVIPN